MCHTHNVTAKQVANNDKILASKHTSTWKQSHPPDPPDSASPPQRTLRQISGDITFQEYLQVFVLVYQRFLLGLKLYFSKVRAWIFT